MGSVANQKPFFDNRILITPIYMLGFYKEYNRYMKKMWLISPEELSVINCIAVMIDCSTSRTTNEGAFFRTYRMYMGFGSIQLAGYYSLYRKGLIERKKVGLRGLSIVLTDKGLLIVQDGINQWAKFTAQMSNYPVKLSMYGQFRVIDKKD